MNGRAKKTAIGALTRVSHLLAHVALAYILLDCFTKICNLSASFRYDHLRLLLLHNRFLHGILFVICIRW